MKARLDIASGLVLATFLATLGGASGCRGAGDRKVVARIADRVVTREEFNRQFTRMEIPAGADQDSLRERCLESIIQKELLVLEAEKRGFFAPDSVTDRAVEKFGSRLLRDRISAEVSKIDSTITDDEVQAAFKLSLDEVQLRHILHWSQAALDSARRRIDGGEAFATVAEQVSHDRRSGKEGGQLPWLNKLELIPEFRSATDTLAQGQVVGPFKSVYGWHVVMLEGRRQREGADMDLEHERIVTAILSERTRVKQLAIQEEYRQRYRLELDEPVIVAMAADANATFVAAAADTSRHGQPLAQAWVPADENRILARYENGQVTVGDYRRLLLTETFSLGKRSTAQGAIGAVLELFYIEAMLREAHRLGYDRDPDWRRQVDLKREELVVERFYNEQVMAGTDFTEAEERAYFDAHPDQFMKMERYRYSYLSIDDASVAEALVQELPKLGAAGFDSVVSVVRASGHLLRSARDSGFLDANQCGAVADVAKTLKAGEVGHVVELDGSHTVFVLIQTQPQTPETFEYSRERVRRTLTNIASEERLVALFKELERKFEVKRYPERLATAG